MSTPPVDNTGNVWHSAKIPPKKESKVEKATEKCISNRENSPNPVPLIGRSKIINSKGPPLPSKQSPSSKGWVIPPPRKDIPPKRSDLFEVLPGVTIYAPDISNVECEQERIEGGGGSYVYNATVTTKEGQVNEAMFIRFSSFPTMLSGL